MGSLIVIHNAERRLRLEHARGLIDRAAAELEGLDLPANLDLRVRTFLSDVRIVLDLARKLVSSDGSRGRSA